MTIFIDNFSDNSHGWLTKNEPEIYLQVESGGYVIEHRRDFGLWATWRNLPNHAVGDLNVQIKIQKILGASDAIYGIIWGLVDINNFCYFEVNTRNQIIIGRCIDSQWHNSIPWTTAPIRQEIGAINEISLFIRKDFLEVHINGFHGLKCEWNNIIAGDNIGFLVERTMKVKILELTISTENSVQIPQVKNYSLSRIKRTHVDSSDLKSVGYENTSHILEIEFINGAIYRYFEVPQLTYVELMQAESHGKYFNAFIRDKFKYQQVQKKLIQQNDYNVDGGDYMDYDTSDVYDPHDEIFGQWIDLGGGERIWDPYDNN